MDAAAILSGQIRLRFGDHVLASLYPLLRMLGVFTLLAAITVVGIWLATLTPRQWILLWADPGWAVTRAFGDLWMVYASGIGAYVAIMALVLVQRWFRLPSQNRIISYEVHGTHLALSDPTGFKSEIPWTAVRRAYCRHGLVMMRLRPKALRYLPLRAFAPQGQDRLWQVLADAGVPVRR